MADIVLPFLLSVFLLAAPQQRGWRADLSAEERWAWIVMGESGGHWEDGSLLVAWTLRAWELKYDIPASQLGQQYGWMGWDRPNWEAIQAVSTVWGRPLAESPYHFMQLGTWCAHLGSAADVRHWREMGWRGDPNFTMPHPKYPNYSMNCYFPKVQ